MLKLGHGVSLPHKITGTIIVGVFYYLLSFSGVGLQSLACGDCGFDSTGGIRVYCECCVLSGRGLCVELITGPEESYRVSCVIV